jgi:hypothetical protein
VDADIEFQFQLALEGLAAEHVRVAACHVVLLKYEGAAPVGGEVRGGGEAAEAGADDERVPVLDDVPLRHIDHQLRHGPPEGKDTGYGRRVKAAGGPRCRAEAAPR